MTYSLAAASSGPARALATTASLAVNVITI